jgi:Fic family protein
MFKYEYHAFRYISISALLNEAPVKYGKSYIHTKTDNMDMTYFTDYQSMVARRAIDQFLLDFSVLVDRYQNFKQQFESSTLYKQTNEKQRAVIILVHNIGIKIVNVTWVQSMVGCSYNTAASVLNRLMELGIFYREKVGREWQYSMLMNIVNE